MASSDTTHDEHEHADDGHVHVHVHSIKFYGAILGFLILLTIITVATSLVDVDGLIQPGTPQGAGGFNLMIAMLIATTKAGFVVTYFMHLRDDSRFNALVFIGSVLFAGVFLAYTMNDTAHRGAGDPYYGVHVLPTTGERAPGGVGCVFWGEEGEPGVADGPTCGQDAISGRVVPCRFVEEGGTPDLSAQVCVFEGGQIVAIQVSDWNGGRHGEPMPHHEGGEHEGHEGGEHAE